MIADCGIRIADFELRRRIVKRIWIGSYSVTNLKSAIVLAALLFGLCVSAQAQQPGKNPRIGILLPWSPVSGVSLSFLKAFHEGLHELGYVEGQNLAIEYRYAEGMSERFPNLAAELVRLKADVIVTTAGPPSLAAKHATTTIPIVFTQVLDPVLEGLVASLARPGGNITGLSQTGPEMAGKRLELLKEAFPKISVSLSFGARVLKPPLPASKRRSSRPGR
jgi:ABC-type uncharacterized transport system substrate-binding protein